VVVIAGHHQHILKPYRAKGARFVARKITFDYYYSQQTEQFTFYRIPKTLFTDERFAKRSSGSKVLYGLMLDRMGLSRKNGWIDKLGRVYIYFTLDKVMHSLGCAREKANRLMAELDSRGIGLIETKRQGLGRANIIYVKDFASRPALDFPV
jgi:hypothetical protein